MIDVGVLIGVVCAYVGSLFLLALWVERGTRAGRKLANNPVVYALSLAVFCTSWTFYGSVGKAATSGALFFSLYLGPTLAMVLGWLVLRKMVRIKTSLRITSIADFISARYDRSPWVAAVVTLIVLIGIAPYIALQLKAVFASFYVLAGEPDGTSWFHVGHLEIIVVVLMILFTNMFGVRRLDPTERHPGIVVVVAVESMVKLAAFLIVGAFVTYGLHDGFSDIFVHLNERIQSGDPLFQPLQGLPYLTWMTYGMLAFFAVMFLPRQFHVAVVENSNESHIRTAMWLFPLYLLLINIFVLPIALSGLLAGMPIAQADTFVLTLPLASGGSGLTLFAFIGGFSAATSMIMISAMTTATMATNHLLLPLLDWFRPLGFLRKRLLSCRWLAVTLGILVGYWFERQLSETQMLVNMGMMSFAAVLQFAPSIVGGMFWRKGNTLGALSGLVAGFAVWFYALIVPAFVRNGWLSQSLMDAGPWGLGFLRPEQMFGLSTLDSLTHAVFWSMCANVGLYVLGSLFRSQSRREKRLADMFVGALDTQPIALPDVKADKMRVDLFSKKQRMAEAMAMFFDAQRARRIVQDGLEDMGLQSKQRITLIELAQLRDRIERQLAGAVGTSTAHRAMKNAQIFSEAESRMLSTLYAEMLVDLNVPPEEVQKRVDYYREREALLTRHAEELRRQIQKKEEEIQQRKKTELALREAESKYRNIFEHAVEGIFQTTLDGRFIDGNPALARIFGFDTREELIQGISDIGMQLYAQPERREAVLKWLQRTDQHAPIEIELVRKNGEVFWASIRGNPVCDDGGNLLYLEGILEDVTAQKEAAIRQQRLEAQLRQAQKMEALGQLAGGIAHDFNNCLHAISGYTELLIQKGRFEESQRDMLNMIAHVASRASGTVRRLLMFARKSEPSFAAVNLNEVVEHTLQILSHTIPKMISIEKDLTPDLPHIFADRFQLEQVLINVASNACDAMPDGGVLRFSSGAISLREAAKAAQFDVEPGDYVALMVADSGLGMDRQTQERVFEPFFTTKELGKGTGLGMSVVYGIVRGHGGSIQCRSQPGDGTTFEILFPQRRVNDPQDAPASGRRVPQGKPSETLLVVDDDHAILEISKTIFGDAGYTVLCAESGEEALEIHSRLGDEIDLIVLDLGMPGMGGARCLEAFRSRGINARIMVSSGYTNHEISRNPKQFGADRFIRKPFRFHQMLEEIHALLNGGVR